MPDQTQTIQIVHRPSLTVNPTKDTATASFLNGHPALVVTEHTYRTEEEIYGEGEPAEFAYEVVKGSVRTYKVLADGRRQICAFHLPGDVFGLVSGATHHLSAEATVNTTLRLVKRCMLEAAARTDVRIAHALWTMTSADLRHAEEHMLLLGRKSTIERVTTFLLEMSRRLANAGMLALPMSRRDIGDYLGLALETVSRTLSQLHDQGILSFSGARHITLHNRQQLVAMNA